MPLLLWVIVSTSSFSYPLCLNPYLIAAHTKKAIVFQLSIAGAK